MAYTSFEEDTATPKEKGSLMFPDPILKLWVGTCQSELQAAIDKCHLRKGSDDVRLAKGTHACP